MDLNLPTGQGKILVITGGREAGKTTYCQQAVEKYLQAGFSVSGLLSPARFDGGEKNGIFVLDLDSRETRLAASSVPGEIEGLGLGNWVFDSKVLEWGNLCLKRVVATDVLVIDELGPLEFELHRGWTAGFDVLRDQRYRLALVVIRPECLDAFSKMGFVFQVREIPGGMRHELHT